jgi:hypothetical protein
MPRTHAAVVELLTNALVLPALAVVPQAERSNCNQRGVRQVQGQPGLRRAEPVLGFKGQCLGHQQAALALTATARDGQLL